MRASARPRRRSLRFAPRLIALTWPRRQANTRRHREKTSNSSPLPADRTQTTSAVLTVEPSGQGLTALTIPVGRPPTPPSGMPARPDYTLIFEEPLELEDNTRQQQATPHC